MEISHIKKLYESRFTTIERIQKNDLWAILCKDILQQFIKPTDVVLDVGAGQCEFINNISSLKKIALDINPHTKKIAKKNVKVIIAPIKNLRRLFKQNTIDVIFMSNLLEHLDSKEDVFRLISEAYTILKKDGRLLIMQPDIKRVGSAYWDFFDHKVPITSRSLKEVLAANNFSIYKIYDPFLPYTTKTRFLPLWPPLLKIYLKLRFLHHVFGKQFFICAQK